MGYLARIGLIVLILLLLFVHRLVEEQITGSGVPVAPAVEAAPESPLDQASAGTTSPGPEASPEPPSDSRTYVIESGDTLERIARKVYGDGQKWQQILAANRDVIPDERRLKIGTRLKIP